MEFHIDLKDGRVPDLVGIGDAVGWLDAAALIDIDVAEHRLRISTSLPMRDLELALAEAGYPVEPGAIVQLPSVCCGGCSG